MTVLLWIWACTGLALMLIGRQSRFASAGLPLAYFFELSLIHVPGAMIYAGSDSWAGNARLTLNGFEQTVIGMVSFLAAVILARESDFAFNRQPPKRKMSTSQLSGLSKLSVIYMIGGFCCFMFLGILSSLPSVGSITSALGSLMIVGVGLRLWVTREAVSRASWFQTVALLPFLPFVTMVKDGFFSFGTHWFLCCIGFLFNQSRRTRPAFILLSPVVGFLALSMFVNWMAIRGEYRQMVWLKQVDFSDRVERIAQLYDKFEWLNFEDGRQRVAIDGRLNQNVLVGLAVERLESGAVEYAKGSVISDLLIALIPRVIWPEKPAVGGGGDVVTRYTGFSFSEGTSVGAGQVFEFFINFGTPSVIVGFFLWGWLLAKMDVRIINCLNDGDQPGFLLWYLISLAMAQPSNNLKEIVVSVASAAVAAKGISYLCRRRFKELLSPAQSTYRDSTTGASPSPSPELIQHRT